MSKGVKQIEKEKKFQEKLAVAIATSQKKIRLAVERDSDPQVSRDLA